MQNNALGLPRKSVRAALAIALTGASIAFTGLQIPASEIYTMTGAAIAFYFADSKKA